MSAEKICVLCADCKYYDDGYCDYVEWDDPGYPHNNAKGFRMEVKVNDDSGLDIWLRVDADFGCVKGVKKT